MSTRKNFQSQHLTKVHATVKWRLFRAKEAHGPIFGSPCISNCIDCTIYCRCHRHYHHHHHHHHYHLTAILPGEPGSDGSLRSSSSSVLEENLWKWVELGFLWAGYPSCHQTDSVRALKGTQGTNHYQWTGIILSSSATWLWTEWALFHSRRLSNVSTRLCVCI